MSVIMVLAVGIVGSLICVYALGYMKDFQAHAEHEAALRGQTAPARRPQFLALMFLFLSAMFVIVTSDNLEWLFCGWEITTVCSFLMIGYTRTPEAIKNAFTQIILNMLGGIAFLVGLMYLHVNGMPLTISGMIELSGAGPAQSALLVLPVVLQALAALAAAAAAAMPAAAAAGTALFRLLLVSGGGVRFCDGGRPLFGRHDGLGR